METFYQGMGEYVRVIIQLSIHHLSRHIIILFRPHCFQCPVIVYK